MADRTKSPNGSRPRFPTVHNPKENLCSGLGSYRSSWRVMDLIPPKFVKRLRKQKHPTTAYSAFFALRLSPLPRGLRLQDRPARPIDRSEERRVGKECRSRWS